MLKLRILTACILIPLVLAGIVYLSSSSFMVITAAIMLLAAWEWSRLSGLIQIPKRVFYVAVQGLIFLLLILFSGINHDSDFHQWREIIIFGLIFWVFISIYLVWARKQSALPTIPPIIRAGLGWLIISVCWMATQMLKITIFYLLFMLLIIWVVDTAAYVGGRLWGKHLLAPTISPKKTWEGLTVGLLVTCLLGLLFQFYINGTRYLWPTLVTIFATSLASIAGDLFESQLKRLEGLKDSGHLLPGHGGILDRIDSLLAAAPVFVGTLLLLNVNFIYFTPGVL